MRIPPPELPGWRRTACCCPPLQDTLARRGDPCNNISEGADMISEQSAAEWLMTKSPMHNGLRERHKQMGCRCCHEDKRKLWQQPGHGQQHRWFSLPNPYVVRQRGARESGVLRNFGLGGKAEGFHFSDVLSFHD